MSMSIHVNVDVFFSLAKPGGPGILLGKLSREMHIFCLWSRGTLPLLLTGTVCGDVRTLEDQMYTCRHIYICILYIYILMY